MINKITEYFKFKYGVYQFCNEVSRILYENGYPIHALINSITALMYLSMIPKLGQAFEEYIANPLFDYIYNND